MKLLRFELYKMTRNVWPLVFLAGFFFLHLLMFSNESTLMTYPEFERKFGMCSIEQLKISFYPYKGDTLEEIYNDFSKEMFPRVFQKSSSSAQWFSFVLAAYIICYDFRQKTVNLPLFTGYSRTAVFLTRLFIYYFICVVISLLTILIMLRIYVQGWQEIYPLSYAWKNIGLYVLQWCATMSLPMLIAFICRNALLSVGITFATELILFYIVKNVPGPFQNGNNINLWVQSGENDMIISAIVISVVYLVVTAVASYFIFRRVELR